MRLNICPDSYFICAIVVPVVLLFFLSNGIEEITTPVVVFNRDLLPPPRSDLISERQVGIIAIITATITALVAAVTAIVSPAIIAITPLIVALTPLLIVVQQVLEFIGCVGVAFAAYFGQCRLSTGRLVYDNDFEPYFDGFRSANSSEIVQFLEQISNVVSIVGCPVIRLANAFCIATDPLNWVIPILQVVGCVGIVTASTAGHCKSNSSRIITEEDDFYNNEKSSLGYKVKNYVDTISDEIDDDDDEVQVIDFPRVNWFNNDDSSNSSKNASEIIQKIQNYSCPIFAFAENLCAISNPTATSITKVVVPILESIGCIGVKAAVLLGQCSSSNRMLIPHYVVDGSVHSLRYGQIGTVITDTIAGVENITCSVFETLNEVCVNFGPSVNSNSSE